MKTRRKKDARDKVISALNFFAEAGLLKRIKRSGWWVAGIEEPESVADHSFRTAVIGFYLSYLENVDPFRIMAMALFNDIHEARINDLHKMGHSYIDFKEAEKKVFKDQIKNLHGPVNSTLKELRLEYDAQKTKESIVARDADILECLLQAKEYCDNGYSQAKHFFTKAPEYLKTKSARTLWQRIQSAGGKKPWHSSDWWQSVVKFER